MIFTKSWNAEGILSFGGSRWWLVESIHMTFQAIVHLAVYGSWGWWWTASFMPMTSVSATCFWLVLAWNPKGRDAVTVRCGWSSFLWPALVALLSHASVHADLARVCSCSLWSNPCNQLWDEYLVHQFVKQYAVQVNNRIKTRRKKCVWENWTELPYLVTHTVFDRWEHEAPLSVVVRFGLANKAFTRKSLHGVRSCCKEPWQRLS